MALQAYYYHDESDTFFIAPLEYWTEDHGIDTILKLGLCRMFTTAEFHHRIIKRKHFQYLVELSKGWVVKDKELLEAPF